MELLPAVGSHEMDTVAERRNCGLDGHMSPPENRYVNPVLDEPRKPCGVPNEYHCPPSCTHAPAPFLGHRDNVAPHIASSYSSLEGPMVVTGPRACNAAMESCPAAVAMLHCPGGAIVPVAPPPLGQAALVRHSMSYTQWDDSPTNLHTKRPTRRGQHKGRAQETKTMMVVICVREYTSCHAVHGILLRA